MKSIFLKVPKIDELHYRKEWLKDEKTMSYNAGYDMKLKGYDKKTGAITKNDEEMITWYKKWIGQEPSKYFAYIYEYNNNIPIGEVYFYKSEIEYKMGILIKNEYRGKGYSKEALIILLKIAFYKMRYEEFKNICFKYFSDEEKRATIKLFENYFIDKNMINYKPTVIHGDLSEDHIIITNDGIGIIDFGDVRVFDPAYDFIWAYLYDEKLFDKIYENYKVNKDNFFKYRIKEFYIKRTAYYGIVYADKINDKQLLEKEMNNLRKYLLK